MGKDFTTTLLVGQSPEEVFKAVTNVRRWWSGIYGEEINGSSERFNDEFTFRAGGGAHYSKQKLVELVPGERVAWLVTESELTFLKKQNEWSGTKIIFEISRNGNKTQVRFTHEGLVPDIECYDSCAPAWMMYIQQKLLPLITSGSGQSDKNSKNNKMENKNFTATIVVNKTPADAFNAIKNFRGWWSEDIQGSTDKLDAEWLYHYKNIHICKIKMIEVVPDKKLVYLVTENEFNFVKDKSEWVNTKLVFDISTEGNKTKVKFTHEGLVPEYECYDVCNDAWGGYINNSLKELIETGKGKPSPKDEDGFNAELAKKWGLNVVV